MGTASEPVPSQADIDAFAQLVRNEGHAHWRELPWRNIDDPYTVLVSEVMLQQTQVKRVLNYWPRFMQLFPTIDALASAETSLVLELWQGLGYNRRALSLKRLAEECALNHSGSLPRERETLLALPGVGPATAGGVLAFAWNSPCVYLETNVRSVFLHHFFPGEDAVPDSRIVPLVERSCPESDVRGWYYALLDYGAYLKATVTNPSRRSRHHSVQSAFEGSHRQKRALLLREVLGQPGIDAPALKARLDAFEQAHGRDEVGEAAFEALLAELQHDGFFAYDGSGYRP